MSSAQSQSLQHSEALTRFDLLDVTSYDVALDLTVGEETFDSVTTVTFESRGGPTFVDLKPRSVRGITLNGQRVDVDTLERGRLPLETAAGTNVLVVDAVMPFRNDGEGLHRSVDPADGRAYVYGMSFMDAAPTVFACFDQPDLKAPYTMHVRTPHDWIVVGNAPAENPEPGRWEIGPTPPLATYFVTVVAGPYHLVRERHDGIPLGLSCRQSLARHLEPDVDELFTMTKQCLDEFHRLFGIRYPFGDYHQAFVPEFNAGAMENPGCVTIRDPFIFDTRPSRGTKIFRATLIAHEMAHQWFGNIITPRWWDDLWLNESFAEYLGNRVAADVTEYHDAWVNVAWSRRTWGLTADERPTTHPVAGNGAADAVAALQDFDGISYSKGSTILKQLATSMGDEVFFGGTAALMNERRFGNIAMHDLFGAWEQAGAGDLSPVVGQWLRTAGVDTFTVDRDRGVLHRTPPADHPAERAHAFAITALHQGSESTHPVQVDGPETEVTLPRGALVMDAEHVSWGQYVPDAETMHALRTELPLIERSELRAAVWNNVKSGYLLGAVDPDDVVELLVADFPADDTEDTPRHTMPWVLGQVLPLASPGSAARVHDATLAKLDDAAAGSEEQLSALHAAIHTATDEPLLRGWLGRTPDGVDLDLDLRWRLLVRLATLGAADRAELDDALASETTALTRVRHTGAVSSLPTPEGKAFAWERFTGVVDVPNYQLEAAGYGLWRGPLELTAPYVERYASDLPATAQVRSGWVLALAAEVFFPSAHTDEPTLSLTRGLLADGVLEPAVRRRVADEVDALERRLSVRARFPKS